MRVKHIKCVDYSRHQNTKSQKIKKKKKGREFSEELLVNEQKRSLQVGGKEQLCQIHKSFWFLISIMSPWIKGYLHKC